MDLEIVVGVLWSKSEESYVESVCLRFPGLELETESVYSKCPESMLESVVRVKWKGAGDYKISGIHGKLGQECVQKISEVSASFQNGWIDVSTKIIQCIN